MNTDQRKRHIESLVKRSIEYRGEIIHKSTLIEKQIEMIIIMYFKMSIDREVEFMELVLDRMTYDAKIAILDQILKKHYEDKYDKECYKTMSTLREIKEVRNKFAHDTVFTGYSKDEKLPKEFSLVNFRNAMTLKDFTKGDFKVFNEKSEKCKNAINRFLQEFII